MDNKMLKNNLFLMKALESKGLSLDEVVMMNVEQISSLPISTKLKQFIFSAQNSTVDLSSEMEIKQKVKEEQKTIDMPDDAKSLAKEYEYVSDSDKEELLRHETEAKLALADDLEIVEKKIANPEVVQMIKDVLQSKETKSVSTYAKIIKTQIPEELLKEVDSTVVSAMINTRIAEIKESENKNK